MQGGESDRSRDIAKEDNITIPNKKKYLNNP